MKESPHSYYFVVKNVGIRVWVSSRFWCFGYYRAGGKRVFELGPLSVFTGE